MLDRLVRGTRMPFGTITPIYRSTPIDNIYSKKGQPCPAPTVCAEDYVTDATPRLEARRRATNHQNLIGAVPLADDISASVITLHQPRPKKAKTGAERARAYRERKKVAAVPEGPACDATPADRKAVEESTTRTGKEVETVSITPTTHTSTVTPIPHPTVTPFTLTPSRGSAAPIILMAAALASPGWA